MHMDEGIYKIGELIKLINAKEKERLFSPKHLADIVELDQDWRIECKKLKKILEDIEKKDISDDSLNKMLHFVRFRVMDSINILDQVEEALWKIIIHTADKNEK